MPRRRRRREGLAPHAAARLDDPEARERARRALESALDRGADLEEAARAALVKSDECVEAWLVLADCAARPDEARDRVRKAVSVATRVMGEAGLREGHGRLADTADGVSYLHAIAALARVQVAEDRAAQAVQSLQHAIAADPRDPVPVRGDLLLLLLALGRDDEGEELVNAYPEESQAEWMLARALVRRRRVLDVEGLARATEALDRAIARFPAAARAIVDERSETGTQPTSGLSPRVEPSSDLDPVLRRAFEDTEGAVDWLRARVAAHEAAASGSRAAESSTGPPILRRDASASPTSPSTPSASAHSDDRRFTALEHVEEARDAEPERREELLRDALDLWPDCAEAWMGLARLAPTPAERVARLREAVAAGRRALGLAPDAPPAPVGDAEDARALLRARDALSRALREIADRRAGEPNESDDPEEAALAEERALLVENPEDPLGVGVRHAARLLALGRDAEAARLLEARREDASPGWVWLRVLAARRAGDRVAASFSLAEATMVASFVGPLLLARGARVSIPEDLSGDAVSEARKTAALVQPAWEATPGALDWLATVLPRPPQRSRDAPGRKRR